MSQYIPLNFDASYLKLDASNDPIIGSLLIKPAVDAASGFEVQDQDGNVILSVDTIKNSVVITTATVAIDAHQRAIAAETYANPTGNTDKLYIGLEGLATSLVGNNKNFTGAIRGLNFFAQSAGSGTVNELTGINAYAQNAGTGQISTAYGGKFQVNSIANAIILAAYGVLISTPYVTAGEIWNTYGLYIHDQTDYAIYTNGGPVLFNAAGNANGDFTHKTDNYNSIFSDASNDSIVLMSNAAGKIGFFGATAVVQRSAIADATDAASVILRCNDVIHALEALGLIAS